MNPRTDLAFFSTLIKSGSLTARPGSSMSALGGQQVVGATRGAARRAPGRAQHAPHQPDQRGRGLSRRRPADPGRDRRPRTHHRQQPRGPRRLVERQCNAGFRTQFIAPAFAKFAAQYPELEIQFLLTSRPLSFAEGAADLGIRFGANRPTPGSLPARWPIIDAGSSPHPAISRDTADPRGACTI